MIVPVILAGGSGTRLWPVSRGELPKPFLALGSSSASLLAATLARCLSLPGAGRALVVANEAHEAGALAEIALAGAKNARLLLEPEARNTAAAICAAALLVRREEGAEAIMLVAPADHVVDNAAALAKGLAEARPLAEQGRLVAFAIRPSHASAAYGHIRLGRALAAACGVHEIAAFIEKPPLERAKELMAQGDCAWNSGMFMFTATAVLAAFGEFQPALLEACRAALPERTATTVTRLSPSAFARAPALSFDRAIMERIEGAAAVLTDLAWHDVGDWDGLWGATPHDASDNASFGNARAVDSTGCLLWSDGPPLVGLGLEGLVAVATPGGVLVAPRARAQQVGALAQSAAVADAMPVALVHKPWGHFRRLHGGPGFQVKELAVRPGGIISLQRHRWRSEHWVCVAGEGLATWGDEKVALLPDVALSIPQGALHRIENTGDAWLKVIEVQLGSYLGEDDIERVEDAYGRV